MMMDISRNDLFHCTKPPCSIEALFVSSVCSVAYSTLVHCTQQICRNISEAFANLHTFTCSARFMYG
uniref:Uncharacterized protein n=1 Tax=Arundo donax TaxID=35708 RepID=A0A0A9HT61_ARUDO